MKTCFFIGHRDAPECVYPALLEEVLRQIELGAEKSRSYASYKEKRF